MSSPQDALVARDRLSAARRALAEAERVSGVAQGAGPQAVSGVLANASRGDRDAGPPGGTDQQRARQVVLRQLAVGPRTRKQLTDRLRAAQVPDGVAEAVLDRMTEVGLVDDAAFADMFVRSRQETKGLAAAAIRHELLSKGVAAETVDQALDGVRPEQERPRAEALVAQRMRTLKGLAPEVQMRRLAGFLARRGYPPGLSYEVIRDAVQQDPTHHRD